MGFGDEWQAAGNKSRPRTRIEGFRRVKHADMPTPNASMVTRVTRVRKVTARATPHTNHHTPIPQQQCIAPSGLRRRPTVARFFKCYALDMDHCGKVLAMIFTSHTDTTRMHGGGSGELDRSLGS